MNVRSAAFSTALLLSVATLTGCGGFDSLLPNQLSSRSIEGVQSHQKQGSDSDKIVVLPLTSTDLGCPYVDIAEGGASFRVGGPDNRAVRYQIDISNVSRNCEPRGAQAAINLGVAGLALVGPAGSPGVFSTDLKILVVGSADKKPVYQKTYKVTVDTKGEPRGTFEMVLEPILVPLQRTDLNNLYDITIGLGNSVSARPAPPKTAKAPAGNPG